MNTAAIQISGDGISWSYEPEPLNLDADNPVEGHFRAWPRLQPFATATMPLDMQERLLTYQIVYGLVEDADAVLLAVTDDADRRRVGIAEVALEAIDCAVLPVEPHADGAAGLMRAHVEWVVQNSERPPRL